MAASFLIRSLCSRIRPQHHRLAAVLSFNQLRRPAFTTAAEERSSHSHSTEKLNVKEYPKLPYFANEVQRRTFLVREILHSGRYEDGERLSAEDQKFVMEDLLCHHPDAEDKIGVGVDYIKVDRHTYYWRSRCLFVVRVDGKSMDFSYKECLRGYKLGKSIPPLKRAHPESELMVNPWISTNLESEFWSFSFNKTSFNSKQSS